MDKRWFTRTTPGRTGRPGKNQDHRVSTKANNMVVLSMRPKEGTMLQPGQQPQQHPYSTTDEVCSLICNDCGRKLTRLTGLSFGLDREESLLGRPSLTLYNRGMRSSWISTTITFCGPRLLGPLTSTKP